MTEPQTLIEKVSEDYLLISPEYFQIVLTVFSILSETVVSPPSPELLVEVAGVEPASCIYPENTSTCLSDD